MVSFSRDPISNDCISAGVDVGVLTFNMESPRMRGAKVSFGNMTGGEMPETEIGVMPAVGKGVDVDTSRADVSVSKPLSAERPEVTLGVSTSGLRVALKASIDSGYTGSSATVGNM